MDPFNNLPAEIRSLILINTGCYKSISAIRQASPTMFQQYQASAAQVAQALFPALLPGQLLQDAIAVVNFPEDGGENTFLETFSFIQKWDNGHLPDALKSRDKRTMAEVVKLYTTLTVYIEDYIGKATSPVSSQEYHKLPSLKGFYAHAVGLGNLSAAERERFLKAFIRYELLCKFHRTRRQYLRHLTDSKRFGQLFPVEENAHDDDLGSFMFHRRWCWDISMGTTPPWDTEAIMCVHEYLCSLFGAISASCVASAAQESDREPANSANSLFCPMIYARQLKRSMGWNEPTGIVPGILAARGFSFATRTLARKPEERAGRLCEFGHLRMEDTFEMLPDSMVNVDTGFHQSPRDYTQLLPWPDNSRWLWDGGPGLAQSLRFRIHRPDWTYRLWDFNEFNIRRVQLTLYRQRAWAFFDDGRLFPATSTHRDGSSSGHFPIATDLRRLDTRALDQFRILE